MNAWRSRSVSPLRRGPKAFLTLQTVPGLPKGGPSSREVGLQSDLFMKEADGSFAAFQPLKLGQHPRDPKLEKEVDRVLRETGDEPSPPQRAQPGITPPTREDGPPLPPSFRVADVKREVERIREARKRIRLGPEAYAGPEVMLASHHEMPKDAKFSAAKPSVCLFTMHDTLDT
jgi:transcription initiation factor TFIID subunit 5